MTVIDTRPPEALLTEALDRFPRVDVAHTPTPLDPALNLGETLGLHLHAGDRLAAAEKVAVREDFSRHLTSNDRTYLATARNADNSRASEQRRARTLFRGVVTAAMILLMGFAIFAGLQWNRANERQEEAARQAAIAVEQSKVAQFQKVAADESRKTAERQTKLAEDRRKIAERQTKLAENQRRIAEEERVKSETARREAEASERRAKAAQEASEKDRQRAESALRSASQAANSMIFLSVVCLRCRLL